VPRLGIGVFVFDKDKILLVKRAQEPALGIWTVPGGLVELGEDLEHAAHREIMEECGIAIRLLGNIDVYEYIRTDNRSRVKYHYVIVEFLAEYLSGELVAGSDVEQARWLRQREVMDIETTEATRSLLEKAIRMRAP
jgi:ADP-ribose pyrophosphatase YjhB (NUDIX family)